MASTFNAQGAAGLREGRCVLAGQTRCCAHTCAVAHHARLRHLPQPQLVRGRGPDLAVAEEAAQGGAGEGGLQAQGSSQPRDQSQGQFSGHSARPQPARLPGAFPVRPANTQPATQPAPTQAPLPPRLPAAGTTPRQARCSTDAPLPRTGTTGSPARAQGQRSEPGRPRGGAERQGSGAEAGQGSGALASAQGGVQPQPRACRGKQFGAEPQFGAAQAAHRVEQVFLCGGVPAAGACCCR